jgi:hypothetical protein
MDNDHNIDDVNSESDDDGNDESIALDLDELKHFMLNFRTGIHDAKIDNAIAESQPESPYIPGAANLEYNKHTGWTNTNNMGIYNLESLLDEFTYEISRTNKEYNLDIVNDDDSGRPGLHPVVWHEPDRTASAPNWTSVSINVSWQKLYTALRKKMTTNRVTRSGTSLEQCFKITKLSIDRVEMAKENIALMAQVCGERSINAMKVIEFVNNNLCADGMMSLAKLVEQSVDLETFIMIQNPINDMNAALSLSRVLKLHPSINQVAMSDCNLGNEPEILSVILQSDVESLEITANNINSLGAIKIAEYLESNTSMMCLHLYDNCLNDDDAVLISRALQENYKLVYLSIYWNNFTSVGVKALFSSIFDSSSLNAISDSNHSLIIDVIRDNYFHRMSKFNRINEGEWPMPDKLLIAMHDKDSLLEYLANLPVELMPRVLNFVQMDRDKVMSLSMVYVSMRYWNMPSLYSHRNIHVKSNPKKKRQRV